MNSDSAYPIEAAPAPYVSIYVDLVNISDLTGKAWTATMTASREHPHRLPARKAAARWIMLVAGSVVASAVEGADAPHVFQRLAPGGRYWVSQYGLNSVRGLDPTGRPLKGFGAAWGAAFFRLSALHDVEAIFPFSFTHVEESDLQLVDHATGERLLPYWRDYHLSRYFPPGSTLLEATSPTPRWRSWPRASPDPTRSAFS